MLINKITSAWHALSSQLFKDSGMQALMLTSFFGNLVRLSSNLVVARLLSPEAFAITGLAASVMFAFNMISDAGFRAFILRHKEGDETYLLKTLWTLRLVRNTIIAVLMFAFSDAIASYFAIEDLALVLKVLCLAFILEGFVPIGFLAIERQNKIARIMYVRFSCSVISTMFMVLGVYYTQNYWPMIAAMIVNHALYIIIGSFFIGWHGSGFALNKKIFLELMAWAKYIIPSSVITLLLVQFDKLMLGKTLSMAELGIYFIAINFSAAAATFTIEYARGVLQPYFSLIYRESPELYLEKVYQKKQRLSMLFAFLLGVLSGGSYLFFDFFYDDRYSSGGLYLSILLVTPIMTLITYSSEVTLILYGHLKTTLIANIIRLIWFFGGAMCSYFWFGTIGLLVTIMTVELLPAIYMLSRLTYYRAVRIGQEALIIIMAVIGFTASRAISNAF
ncbi:MAG: O-antigen/teichoic acid export membrane protein [Candidatus Endobugula sp.]|jgi:lipopolysaccharide exporter